MSRTKAMEKFLLQAVRVGVVLLLLMPLVVATQTAYPFSVGKAVYARSLIEVVFVLWVLLALIGSSWRPPRSWLLALLAAGLAVSVLSAVFGVSLERSFWSSYIRMQGTVELTHWFALAVVVASVFHTSRSLRVLLTLHLGVGLLVSLAAIAMHGGWEIPALSRLPVSESSRANGTFGNPIYLGAYLMVNVVLALGFLVRSFMPEPTSRIVEGGRRKAGKKEERPPDALVQWVERAFYGAAVLLGLWGISLSGSMAALAGLLAALGALMLLYSFLARSRRIRLAARALLSLMVGGMLALALLVFVAPSLIPSFDSPLLNRLTDPETVQRTLTNRLAIWKTGIEGFAERPVLGWGEDNYVVVSGRYASGRSAIMPSNDHAHNRLIEEGVTKGLVGLAVYVALWLLTFLAILRGIRGVDPRERAFGLFAGAALLSQLVQQQTLFATATSSLQHVLLLAVAIRYEGMVWLKGAGFRLPELLATVFRRRVVHGCMVLGAAALGGVGLASNQAVYSGAAAMYRAEVSGQARFMDEIRNAVEAFDPLANVPRLILFENLTKNWNFLRRYRSAEAMRLLRWADVEAGRAVEAEPENWMVAHALARLYRVVALTDPGYAERAKLHFERALELAPHKDPMVPLDAPHWRKNQNRQE